MWHRRPCARLPKRCVPPRSGGETSSASADRQPENIALLFSRNGVKPVVVSSVTSRSASAAASTRRGGRDSGPPVDLGEGVLVMATPSFGRRVGGIALRSPVGVGANSLVGPQSALIGCRIGADCYVATAVIVFRAAEVRAGTRVGASSIVHAGALLRPASRVRFRQVAAPDAPESASPPISTRRDSSSVRPTSSGRLRRPRGRHGDPAPAGHRDPAARSVGVTRRADHRPVTCRLTLVLEHPIA
jgi:hypothetical protein